LNATFLAACTNEIATAGNNVLDWSQQSAYGTSFPSATKAVESAGWYFSADQAFDMVVAYQLNPNTNYLKRTGGQHELRGRMQPGQCLLRQPASAGNGSMASSANGN
jgi:hypothetical protein